jgi:demethylmenaquinone methyltransferase/2-methoxy-6-polyprenyl-1,4-benzoquinol methylase
MSDIVDMFNRIAPRYDVLNRTLSFGQDILWRKCVADAVANDRATSYLDVATGTGDLLFDVVAKLPDLERAVGVDPANAMLSFAKMKAAKKGFPADTFLQGDALALPFKDEMFDAVTVGFGIRNMTSIDAALGEISRVLRPKGRLYVLEFSVPRLAFVRVPYLLYFRHVLPYIGHMISGDSVAYRYLNKSVESFPCGHAMVQIMNSASFGNVSVKELTLGIASLYVGEKC